MRENRTSGSEGGESVQSRLSYPYQKVTDRNLLLGGVRRRVGGYRHVGIYCKFSEAGFCGRVTVLSFIAWFVILASNKIS